jgi:hypothetical protein
MANHTARGLTPEAKAWSAVRPPTAANTKELLSTRE